MKVILPLLPSRPWVHPWRTIALTLCTTLIITNARTIARAENLDHVRQLLSTKQCQRCDFIGAGLVMAQLPGADLRGANLTRANLSQANLVGADLRGARLAGASLSGANLSGANLTGADLRNTDLRGTIFSSALLTDADLEGAGLRGAIDLPSTIGTPELFYEWAIDSAQQKRYDLAIDQFSQALVRDPSYAPAFFGRSIARFEIGDRKGAVTDMALANALFKTQGNIASVESSAKVLAEMQKPPQESDRGGNGFGTSMLNFVGGLLKLFILR